MNEELKEKIKDLTFVELKEWQDKLCSVQTIGEWKAVGREFRDKYNLTDRQALDILRGDI